MLSTLKKLLRLAREAAREAGVGATRLFIKIRVFSVSCSGVMMVQIMVEGAIVASACYCRPFPFREYFVLL